VQKLGLESTELLLGGDWNHGMDYDFPFSWEYIIIPTDELHHFSEG